jgi:hypothetical protein
LKATSGDAVIGEEVAPDSPASEEAWPPISGGQWLAGSSGAEVVASVQPAHLLRAGQKFALRAAARAELRGRTPDVDIGGVSRDRSRSGGEASGSQAGQCGSLLLEQLPPPPPAPEGIRTPPLAPLAVIPSPPTPPAAGSVQSPAMLGVSAGGSSGGPGSGMGGKPAGQVVGYQGKGGDVGSATDDRTSSAGWSPWSRPAHGQHQPAMPSTLNPNPEWMAEFNHSQGYKLWIGDMPGDTTEGRLLQWLRNDPGIDFSVIGPHIVDITTSNKGHSGLARAIVTFRDMTAALYCADKVFCWWGPTPVSVQSRGWRHFSVRFMSSGKGR